MDMEENAGNGISIDDLEQFVNDIKEAFAKLDEAQETLHAEVKVKIDMGHVIIGY